MQNAEQLLAFVGAGCGSQCDRKGPLLPATRISSLLRAHGEEDGKSGSAAARSGAAVEVNGAIVRSSSLVTHNPSLFRRPLWQTPRNCHGNRVGPGKAKPEEDLQVPRSAFREEKFERIRAALNRAVKKTELVVGTASDDDNLYVWVESNG